jgi:hypothetical protein
LSLRSPGCGVIAQLNPFTTTPVQCNFVSSDGTKCLDGTTGSGYDHTDIPKANWMVAPTFGKATAYTAYQTPRTFTLSVGVRF